MRRPQRWLEALATVTAVVLCGLVLWPQADGDAGAPPELVLSASGGMKLWNSKAGGPVVGAAHWRPGKRVRGRVAVANRGAQTVVVRLSARAFKERGAALSLRTRVRIRRIGRRLRPAERKVVYRGNLRKLKNDRITLCDPA